MATVAIIVLAAVGMPLLNIGHDALSTEVEYDNTPTIASDAAYVPRMSLVENGTVTFSWNGSAATLNGKTYTSLAKTEVIVMSQNLYVSASTSSGISLTSCGYLDSSQSLATNTIKSTTAGMTFTLTVTPTGYTLTYNNAGQDHTKTGTHTWAAYKSDSGKYIGAQYNLFKNIYYSSKVYGVSNSGGYMYSYDGTDGYKDGVKGTVTNTSATVGDGVKKAVCSNTKDSNSIVIKNEAGTGSSQIYCYLVPAQIVTGGETAASSLIGVIPVMLIVAVLMAMVGYIGMKRD